MTKIPNFISKAETKVRTGFHASDFGKSSLDLYFAWTGEEVSNPIKWFDKLKMGAGKGVELEMLKVLKESDVVNPEYDQEKDGRVNFKYKDIEIHGYIDAITKSGKAIEIKSINNKNAFDIKKYEEGLPRASYVGQLATYNHFLGNDIGYLFVSTVDGLRWFWLENNKIGNMNYACESVIVDLEKEYDRWNKLYVENILPRKLPDIWENVYKIPIEELDLSKYSKTDLKKAYAGDKVLGSKDSWMITYSPYKDKIIKLQGSEVGYSEEEHKKLKKLIKEYV